MRKIHRALFLALSFAIPFALVSAQEPTPPAAALTRATGDVTQIAAGHMVIHSDKGDIQVTLPDGVKLLRVPPGAKDLKFAQPITSTEINPGDRAIVAGHLADDHQTLNAVRVVVMTKSDISDYHAAEVREWQTRGIEGVVKSIDSSTSEITIAAPNHPPTPGNMTHPVVMTTTHTTLFMRYAPNSVQFADAKPSAFNELKAGDQLRALGTASDDKTHYAAEKIVFGTFHNIGATVMSVDAQANTVTVKNLANNKPVVVHTNADCKMHQLPDFVAQMIARLATGTASPAGGGAGAERHGEAASSGPPVGGPGGPGGGGGMRRGGVGNLSQALEHMPTFNLADLKKGEPVVIFSSEGATPSDITAIYILTGVEPILAALPKGGGEMNLGTWNLSLGGGGESAQ